MKPVKLEVGMDEWTSFLSCNEHYIFHCPEYVSFIESTFPTAKACYLGVMSNSKLTGLFPFFYVSQPGLKRVLSFLFPSMASPKSISSAYNDYGGPCGSIDRDKLFAMLHVLKNKFSSPYLEIRQGLEKFDEYFANLPSLKYKRFILPLSSKESVWNGIQKYKRKAIGKAESAGVVTREIPLSDIDSLYSLYSKNMRAFGDPPYPKRYFINFYKYFIDKGLGKCFGAYKDGKLIAMLLGYCCSGRVHIIIAVSDDKYLELRPNDAVHWAFISWACDNKYKLFDFGHTREGSGQYTYKERWGGECKDLNRYYLLSAGQELPNMDPTDKANALYPMIWRRLPLCVTTSIGPWLRESLGI
ncbi:MAG: GNAT family N-acetyltransferase [Candidatus Woesearchaeota archaeon]